MGNRAFEEGVRREFRIAWVFGDVLCFFFFGDLALLEV